MFDNDSFCQSWSVEDGPGFHKVLFFAVKILHFRQITGLATTIVLIKKNKQMEAISKNWNEIRLRINVDTTIEKVYRAWTTQAGLESWFLRQAKAKDPKGNAKKETDTMVKGDSYDWMWHGFPDDVRLEGRVLESNGKDKFVFSFSMDCPVTISIYKEQGQVIVELVEANIPTDEGVIFKHYLSNTTGWTFYLTNLKSVLEGGLDMRNFNAELKNVITA